MPTTELELARTSLTSGAGWVACWRPEPSGELSLRVTAEDGAPLPDQSHADGIEIVFDGELYNRAQLAERFANSDGAWLSDSELILQTYRRCGESALQEIKGYFALIIWDRDRETLLCARDRVGIYPLFHAKCGSERLLALGIPELLRDSRVSRNLSRVVLADQLCQRWGAAEETPYTAIKRVPAGTFLRIRRESESTTRYWEPVTADGVDWVGEDRLGEFDDLFEQAVDRCQGTGQAGIFLSGGFDSVSVAAMAVDICRRHGRELPHALSLGFPVPECNEQPVQRQVAESLNLRQQMLGFDEAVGPQGLVSAALEMNADWPLPMANPWRPAYFQLAQSARSEGCDTIVTGGGGDEWLCVNPDYMADLLRRFHFGGAYRFLQAQLRSYRMPARHIVRFLLWNAGVRLLAGSQARRMIRWTAPGLLRRRRMRRLARRTPPWIAPDPELQSQMRERIEESVLEQSKEPEPAVRYGYYLRGIPPVLAHPRTSGDLEENFEFGRRLGMRFREPYWDADLLQYLCRVPPELLLRGGREKGLVRETVARRFPNLGFERHRKVTAADFFRVTLQTQGQAAWKHTGGTPALVELGIVDRQAVDALVVQCFKTTDLRVAHRLWELLILETWLQSRI
jgi:asparagine synthase (glutamine-hydrolysing)